METDIGNPIQYNPDLKEDERSVQEEEVYYQPPPPAHMMYPSMMQQPPPMVENTTLDFSNLDKNTYIVMFIAFIVGFFMGKTMQPVILRAM
jgi:hypothetical protein